MNSLQFGCFFKAKNNIQGTWITYICIPIMPKLAFALNPDALAAAAEPKTNSSGCITILRATPFRMSVDS